MEYIAMDAMENVYEMDAICVLASFPLTKVVKRAVNRKTFISDN